MTQWLAHHVSVQEAHTQTDICIGTATILSLPNIVCLTPSDTWPALSVQNRSYLDKNNNTSGLLSIGITTLNRSSTDYKLNCTLCRDKDNKTNNIYIVVPYSNGLSYNFKNVCSKAKVQVPFRKGNTTKDLLMTPKDKDNITGKG